MPRVTWDDPGKRLYQTGIDRGMFYVDTIAAPWIGLIGISESSDGGDAQSYYVDGRKTLDIPVRENFGATIESFSIPVEFAVCAGRQMISPALFVADQPRKSFGFSYRTLIGNDLQIDPFAYKIHIVYNATAKVSDFTHQTITETASAESRSVDVTTVPIFVDGYRPASHFVFDTTVIGSDAITTLEGILYGDDSNDPRLPTALELLNLLAV